MSKELIQVKKPFRCGGRLVKAKEKLEVGRDGDVTKAEARALVGQGKADWVEVAAPKTSNTKKEEVKDE